MHCLSRSALNTHLILRDIIGILEYHVDRNAGQAYLRDGISEPKTPGSCLEILHAKFGRMQSTIGDGITPAAPRCAVRSGSAPQNRRCGQGVVRTV
jgi:hypothetical protein